MKKEGGEEKIRIEEKSGIPDNLKHVCYDSGYAPGELQYRTTDEEDFFLHGKPDKISTWYFLTKTMMH